MGRRADAPHGVHVLLQHRGRLDACVASPAPHRASLTCSHHGTEVDDGDRVAATCKAVGALVLHVLAEAKKAGELDPTRRADLETLLREAAEWDDLMGGIRSGAGYADICRAIALRLFGSRTPAERRALERARVEEWVAHMEPEDRKDYLEAKKRREADEAEEEEEEDKDKDKDKDEEWFKGGAGVDESKKPRGMALVTVWQMYRSRVNAAPNCPMRGPPEWDISEWTENDRKEFLFDNMDA
jgi:hypothetical protein